MVEYVILKGNVGYFDWRWGQYMGWLKNLWSKSSSTSRDLQSDSGLQKDINDLQKSIYGLQKIVISISAIGIVAAAVVIPLTIYQMNYISNTFSDVRSNISDIRDDITDLRVDIGRIDERTDSLQRQLNELRDDFRRLDTETRAIQQSLFSNISFMRIYPTDDFRNFISLNFVNPSPNISGFDNEVLIGTNGEGENLYFSDLEENHFYMSFPDDQNRGEIWFFGGLDEHGRWHGFCIINHYIDGQLIALDETHFLYGERIGDYRHISREIGQYRLQYRSWYGDFTDGETFVYQSITFPTERFKTNTPIRFEDAIRHTLISYYRGRISNGYFNDNTGNAISISYTEEGFIRTLYRGHFVNGAFVDQRPFDENSLENSAFWIALANDESRYYFYAGPFLNNQPRNNNWHLSEERRISISENPAYRLPHSLIIRPELLRWRTWDDSQI